MASKSHNPSLKKNKLLGQLLQEKQQPFNLNTYLLERGYSIKEANPQELGSFCSYESLKTSFNKRKKKVPRFSKIVRALVHKVVSVKNCQQTDVEKRNAQENNDEEEEERFSSASCTTLFNSCSGSDTESSQKIAAPDRREYKWRCMEDKQQQQLSPVSVLEETHSDQNSPVHKNVVQRENAKRGGETSTVSDNINNITTTTKKVSPVSMITSKLLENPSKETYSKIKSQLSVKTQELLLDCVREVIQSYKLKDKILQQQQQQQQQQQHFLGAEEEIQRLLLDDENVVEWSKQSKENSLLINWGPWASLEEWNDGFEQERKEIATAMGDFILEDIIYEFITATSFC